MTTFNIVTEISPVALQENVDNIVHHDSTGLLVLSEVDKDDPRPNQQMKYVAYRPVNAQNGVFEKIGEVAFQKGHPGSFGINGFTNEAVISLLIDRLLRLNDLMPCEENIKALARLQEVNLLLMSRSARMAASYQQSSNLKEESANGGS